MFLRQLYLLSQGLHLCGVHSISIYASEMTLEGIWLILIAHNILLYFHF